MTIKHYIRESFVYRIYKKVLDRQLLYKREKYFTKLRSIVTPDTSIISSNCFAGRIMQDLKMEYNSPTLGLYFFYPDYIEFLNHLEYYLKEAKIQFVAHSKYPLGDKRRAKWKHWYPIGLLGGKVEIHFLHYHTEEEAASKWYRRAARVNLNKLLIVGFDQNQCTPQNIKDFDALPFNNKIFFSAQHIEGKNIIFIKEFEKQGYVGDPYKDGHIFYQCLVSHIKPIIK